MFLLHSATLTILASIMLAGKHPVTNGFVPSSSHQSFKTSSALFSTVGSEDPFAIAYSRFPTSVDDQVRQAGMAIKAAAADGIHRHGIRLLLPLIGATELDDWPGGALQQMDAASPLVRNILSKTCSGDGGGAADSGVIKFQESIVDESDGVRALFAQAGNDPLRDACAILLPTADVVGNVVKSIDKQVGDKRDFLLINAQWRRAGDFPFFGRKEQVQYVGTFQPTYHCSNLMVEGEQVRVLRSYPGDWRVFLMVEGSRLGSLDWKEIGSKPVASLDEAKGGELFDFGKPTYVEIENMIKSQEGYVAKTMAERAQSSINFIKDTL